MPKSKETFLYFRGFFFNGFFTLFVGQCNQRANHSKFITRLIAAKPSSHYPQQPKKMYKKRREEEEEKPPSPSPKNLQRIIRTLKENASTPENKSESENRK